MNYEMTDEEMIDRLQTIKEQYPDYSTAYEALDMAISKLSVSNNKNDEKEREANSKV